MKKARERRPRTLVQRGVHLQRYGTARPQQTSGSLRTDEELNRPARPGRAAGHPHDSPSKPAQAPLKPSTAKVTRPAIGALASLASLIEASATWPACHIIFLPVVRARVVCSSTARWKVRVLDMARKMGRRLLHGRLRGRCKLLGQILHSRGEDLARLHGRLDVALAESYEVLWCLHDGVPGLAGAHRTIAEKRHARLQ